KNMIPRLLVLLYTCVLLATAQLERMSEPKEESEGLTEKDRISCRELKAEYRRVCLDKEHRAHEEEFCRAFENVCIRLASGDRPHNSEHAIAPQDGEGSFGSGGSSHHHSHHRPDFTEFCRRFKNRYLYICPNPFRFGQKAVVFCPIYSERCYVPLPDKPVLPKPKSSGRNEAVERMCASYAGFANQYCSNALALSQAQYRSACEKYWRFCLKQEQ
ncbi:hypothetical protein PMAYCL1PPCAC_09655, partial [Pristionchus mayeri]